MNYRMLSHLLSTILLIEAALLLIPTVVSLIYGEPFWPFLVTIGILVAVSLPFAIPKPKDTRIYAKEGFVCVSASWILMSAFGALPFVFSGAIPNYINALFETVSGFTTTGASILSVIETLPKGILFWRSLTHWVGGMGVLVFMLAILPTTGGNAIHLLRAEVPGPTKGKIVPKLKQTALILYGIYILLTLIMIGALLCTGMPLYDGVVNSLATAGTGGFSVLNNSIAGYASPAAEWIIALFMFLFGVNFNIYFFILIGKARDVIRSEEFRVYAGLTFGSVLAIILTTVRLFDRFGDCVRAAFFQVTSIMSTTGFTTVDFNEWPTFSKSVLLLLMLVGACAGSTAGGLKISRVMILFKNIIKEFRHLLHPHSVNIVRIDNDVVREETTKAANNYLSIYFLLIVVSTLLLAVDGFDLETNLTSAITCINNIGPGLGAIVGPAGNFSAFSWFAKLLLSLDMLFGRLEIMPMIILFSPSTWRRK